MNDKYKQLNDVVDDTQCMLDAAAAGNWDEVFCLEEKRGKKIQTVFSLSFNNEEELQCNAMIQRIISLNKKLESLTVSARDEIAEQAGSINKGRHAVGVYAQNSG